MTEWIQSQKPQQTPTPPQKTKQKQSRLTELVADALVAQQRRVLKGVPAVEDAGVGAHRRDAAQRQHSVVNQQRGRLLPEPSQHGAVAAVLGVAEHQHLAGVVVLGACRDTKTQQGRLIESKEPI